MKKLLTLILILSTLAMASIACEKKEINNSSNDVNIIENESTQVTSTQVLATQSHTMQTPTTTEKHSDIENIQNSIKYEVSRDEWKNAFDFSTYGNFVYTFDEMLGEHDSVWLANGTVESKDGTLYRNIKLIENGEEEIYSEALTGEPFCLENNSILLGCMMEEFNKSASLGYTMFDYKEDSKSYYSNNVDMDGTPCDINIWFENGKIIKITLKGYADFQEVDATYFFSFN